MRFCFSPFGWRWECEDPFDFAKPGSGIKFITIQEECEENSTESAVWRKIRTLPDYISDKFHSISVPGKCFISRNKEHLFDELATIVNYKPRFVRPTIDDKDPHICLRRYGHEIYPTYLNNPANSDLLYNTVCTHMDVSEGEEVTRKKLDDALTDGTELVALSRFVIRAEEIRPHIEQLSKAGKKTRVYMSGLGQLEEGTKKEFDWLDKEWLSEEQSILDYQRLIGKEDDPIYAWPCRVGKESVDKPHLLGNLITRFGNLIGIWYMIENHGIDIDGNLCQWYQYDSEYCFGGTLKFGANEEDIIDSIVLAKFKQGPGRYSSLYELGEKDVDLALDCFKELENKAERLESADLKNQIEETKNEAIDVLDQDIIQMILRKGLQNDLWKLICDLFSNFDHNKGIEHNKRVADNLSELKTRICVYARSTWK